MLRIIFHALMLPAMLWIDRQSAVRLAPCRAATCWYLLGVPLILVESSVSGSAWKGIATQSAVTALFFLPPAYAAFRYGLRRERSIFQPFLLFLILSCPAGLLSAFVLARTSFAFGSF